MSLPIYHRIHKFLWYIYNKLIPNKTVEKEKYIEREKNIAASYWLKREKQTFQCGLAGSILYKFK